MPSSTGSTRAAEHQVGVADDAGAGADLAVDAARRHRGDAVDELDLADRLHLFRDIGAQHRARLHEHRRQDVVAAVGIGEQVVEQVAPVLAVPQVMMRIDDRQVGLEDRLRAPGEPVVADVKIVRGLGRALLLRHRKLRALLGRDPHLRRRRADVGFDVVLELHEVLLEHRDQLARGLVELGLVLPRS